MAFFWISVMSMLEDHWERKELFLLVEGLSREVPEQKR